MVVKSKSLSKAMAIGAACLALNFGVSNNFTGISNVAVASGPSTPDDQPSNWGKWYAKLIFIVAGLVPGCGVGFVLGKNL